MFPPRKRYFKKITSHLLYKSAISFNVLIAHSNSIEGKMSSTKPSQAHLIVHNVSDTQYNNRHGNRSEYEEICETSYTRSYSHCKTNNFTFVNDY